MGGCFLNLTIHSVHVSSKDVVRLHSRTDTKVIWQIDNESIHPFGNGPSSIGGAIVDDHDVGKGGILLDAGDDLAEAVLFVVSGDDDQNPVSIHPIPSA